MLNFFVDKSTTPLSHNSENITKNTGDVNGIPVEHTNVPPFGSLIAKAWEAVKTFFGDLSYAVKRHFIGTMSDSAVYFYETAQESLLKGVSSDGAFGLKFQSDHLVELIEQHAKGLTSLSSDDKSRIKRIKDNVVEDLRSYLDTYQKDLAGKISTLQSALHNAKGKMEEINMAQSIYKEEIKKLNENLVDRSYLKIHELYQAIGKLAGVEVKVKKNLATAPEASATPESQVH